MLCDHEAVNLSIHGFLSVIARLLVTREAPQEPSTPSIGHGKNAFAAGQDVKHRTAAGTVDKDGLDGHEVVQLRLRGVPFFDKLYRLALISRCVGLAYRAHEF